MINRNKTYFSEIVRLYYIFMYIYVYYIYIYIYFLFDNDKFKFNNLFINMADLLLQ